MLLFQVGFAMVTLRLMSRYYQAITFLTLNCKDSPPWCVHCFKTWRGQLLLVLSATFSHEPPFLSFPSFPWDFFWLKAEYLLCCYPKSASPLSPNRGESSASQLGNVTLKLLAKLIKLLTSINIWGIICALIPTEQLRALMLRKSNLPGHWPGLWS